MSSMSMRLLAGAFLVAVLLLPARLLAEGYDELIRYLPPQPNAVAFVDIEKAMSSPIAVSEGWVVKRKDLQPTTPLMVPRQATRVLSAAQLDCAGGLGSLWRVALMELREPMDLSAVASAKNGGIDELAGKHAAWTPENAYYIQLDEQVLGVVTPANRQFAQRWAASQEGARALSPRLAAARKVADDGTPFVLAMDLDGAFSRTGVLRYMRAVSPTVRNSDDPAIRTMAALLASVQGVTLTVDLTDKITAHVVVDFGADAAPLKSIAKKLSRLVLSDAGLYLDDMDGWAYDVKGRQMTADGQLTTESLQWLVSLVASAIQYETATEGEAATPTAAAQGQGDAAPAVTPTQPPPPAQETGPSAEERQKLTASRTYFKTISSIVDKRYGKADSMSRASEWLLRDATRIRNMPVLKVDPDLVNWGLEVSQALNGLALQVRAKQSQVHADLNAAQPPSAYYYSYSDYNGYYGDFATDVAESRVKEACDQWMTARDQVGMDARAQVAASGGQVLTQLRDSATRMRITMSQRYGVEF